jgi:hypothetical protein
VRPNALMIVAAGCFVAESAGLTQQAGQRPNLLPNPSFESVEPPLPSPRYPTPTEAPAETWLPRTWGIVQEGGAAVTCPDDPDAARVGRRCSHIAAPTGIGRIRYLPVPVADSRPWTVSAWVRGEGSLHIAAWDVTSDHWFSVREQVFELQAGWARVEFAFEPPDGCRKGMLEFATSGPADAWIDDVTVTHPNLLPVGLPPAGRLERDEHTLLYLPFEELFDEYAFFVKPGAELTGPTEGLFGRALRFGPDGYLACSATENLDPSRGTIEVWCKLLSPGNDGVAHGIVSVPGPEGMWLGKDQYGHVTQQFSSGWARLSGCTAMGYANSWQPGVWRHIAACWDSEGMQLFVDGKLIAWQTEPRLSRALGPELALGSPGMELDDLRISSAVRYRIPVRPD